MIKVLKRKQVKCCMNCKHWKYFPPTPGQATLGAGMPLCTRAIFAEGTVFLGRMNTVEGTRRGQSMSGPRVVTVKCCKNCKYYRVDPFQQPWEDGCPDYVCTKLLKEGPVSDNDIKSVREDNYCKDYERRRE